MNYSPELIKGTLKTILLKLLADNGRMYGYEITQRVRELTDERIKITEGALYPTLHALEASGMMMGSLTKLGTQLWYGIGGGGDAKGFPGAVEIVHSDLVSDGGGTTATTGSSIYGLKLGAQYVQFVFGLGQVFTLGEWRKQTMIRSSKSLTCWLNSLSGYVGVQWVNKYAVGRLKDITADSGKTATDAMIGTWLSKYPVGLKPDVLFMSRRTAMQLQTARSATSITNSSPKANNGGDVWAPEPVSSNGIPIVVTDSLLDTETLT